MNIGPAISVSSSAAGAPLSQTSGSEAERANKDASAQSRQSDAESKAADAAGIGQTEQDQETSERDADGRRFWEAPPEGSAAVVEDADEAPGKRRLTKDPSGNAGNALDLMG